MFSFRGFIYGPKTDSSKRRKTRISDLCIDLNIYIDILCMDMLLYMIVQYCMLILIFQTCLSLLR
jgi:hypothetical protein